MNLLRSPRAKLVLATVLLLSLAAVAAQRGWSATVAARSTLALMAVATVVLWLRRTARPGGHREHELRPRLEVIARSGLSPRAGVALVCADGRSFLIVHGDGYAEVRGMTEEPAPAGHQAIDTDRFAALNRRSTSRHAIRRVDQP